MVKLYVEGGGDAKALKVACRAGFNAFITKAGLAKRPRIVACGGRRDAYESFCTAIDLGEDAMLLVDSEEAIAVVHQQDPDTPGNWAPWMHLKQRVGDGWDKPNGSADTDCHLMVHVMENWFLADRTILTTFFGQGFNENALPALSRPIENIDKNSIYKCLDNATSRCKTKHRYGKGEHSFKLLAEIDPQKIVAASPWANRFIDSLQKKMAG